MRRLFPLMAALLLVASPAHAEVASWYGGSDGLHGQRTASGEIYDQWADSPYTAAHRTLPFGTRVAVAYGNARVVVCISDRGPAAWTGRDIDLNRAAARALGLERVGVATVRLVVLGRPSDGCT